MAFDNLNESVDQHTSGLVLFKGTVTNNNDPLGLDRIQVDVPELYDSQSGGSPWCLPIKHSPFGQGSSWGVYGVPAVGSVVCIIQQQNDPEFPAYIGDLSATKGNGFGDNKTWGFVDPGGNKLVVGIGGDLTFTHNSGVNINISSGGDVSVTNVQSAQLSCSTLQATASGSATVKGSSITLDTSSTTCTGNLNVAGSLNCGTGSGGGTATINGSLRTVGGDIVANSISLENHVHRAQGEYSETSTPI